MKFTSYAQNGEDVVLYRALKHVWNGTYVDIGAFDPTRDSVTRAFYDRGWSGINVEPIADLHARLEAERPRDRNIHAAISDAPGTLPYYVVDESGRSTLDRNLSLDYQNEGHTVREVSIPVLTMNELLDTLQDRPIHFLKIDVEGLEEKVLAGLDLQRFRPWILVIEATLPGQTTLSYAGWEHHVLSARYQFAYFDGLNRYYVADERSDLAPVLAIAPNVFDDFETLHVVELREALEASGDSYYALSSQILQEREAARAHSQELSTLIARLGEELSIASEELELQREEAQTNLRERNDIIDHLTARTAELENENEHYQQELVWLRSTYQGTSETLARMERSRGWKLVLFIRRRVDRIKLFACRVRRLLARIRRVLFRSARRLIGRPAHHAVLTMPSSIVQTQLQLQRDFLRPELKRKIALRALWSKNGSTR